MITDVEAVRLGIGDTESSPFYPVLTDAQIEYYLFKAGSVDQAIKRAAMAACAIIVSTPTKEYVGDTELWTAYSSEYRKWLDLLLDDSKILPNGLRAYFVGVSWADICKHIENPDRYVNPLAELANCNAKKKCGSC